MQAVFTVAAAALSVPVLFHTSNVSEMLAGDAAPGAPGSVQRPGKPRAGNSERRCKEVFSTCVKVIVAFELACDALLVRALAPRCVQVTMGGAKLNWD